MAKGGLRKMTLATSITQSYYEQSKPFFESTNKYFKGKKVCFCIGFRAEITGWETVEVRFNKLECLWQPTNRHNYYSLQHGEFIRHYDFSEDEDILFVDSDMILQREWDLDMNVESACFYVTRCSFPPIALRDVAINLGSNLMSVYPEFCACFMLAKASTWHAFYHFIKNDYEAFLSKFNHHAAWQLLINLTAYDWFNVQVLDCKYCTAEWYSGSRAVYENDILRFQNDTVYFNHTKFNNV